MTPEERAQQLMVYWTVPEMLADEIRAAVAERDREWQEALKILDKTQEVPPLDPPDLADDAVSPFATWAFSVIIRAARIAECAAVAEERERCARVAETHELAIGRVCPGCSNAIANAIRNGPTPTRLEPNAEVEA